MITQPIVKPITQPIVSGLFGAIGANPLKFHALTYDPVTFEMLGVKTGVGDLTEANTAERYYADYENIWRSFGSAVPGWYGGRVVENLILQSDDLTATWLNIGGTIVDSETFAVTASGNRPYQLALNAVAGETFIASVLFASDVDIDFVMRVSDGSNITSPLLSLVGGTAAKRYTFSGTWANDYANAQWQVFRSMESKNATITIKNMQFENSTGRTDTTTPSEYIPTTTAPVQKVFANENGNTVTSNVVTEAAGPLLADMPWLVGQSEQTCSTLYSVDFTDAAWVKVNGTAAKDAVGLRSDANGASTLTATSANATFIQTITAASGEHATRFFVRRKTGTGAIELTVDGGSTWTAITIDADYDDYQIDQAAVTNPGFGLRIVTSGDEVEVGSGQGHLTATKESIRRASPIFTEGSTVTITASDLSLDDANHSDTQGCYFLEFRNAGLNGVNTGGLIGLGASGRLVYTDAANRFRAHCGSAATLGPVVTLAADDTEYKIGMAYGDSNFRTNTDNSWGAEAAYDGSFNNTLGKINVLASEAMVGGPPCTILIRNLRRYNLPYAAAQAKIDELMA